MEQNAPATAAESTLLGQHFTIPKLLKFALPAIITAIFSALYGIVDGLFVSNVAGSTAFGATNLVLPLMMIVAAFGYMFGTGGTALVSKIMGEGDIKKANNVFSLITYALILVGVVFTVLLEIFFEDLLQTLGCSAEMLPLCLIYGRLIIPFLPCFMLTFFFQSFCITAGKAKFGLIIMLISGCVNMLGDFILVGLIAPNTADVTTSALLGSAGATALGLLISSIVPLVYYFCKNSSSLRLGKPVFSGRVLGRTCSNGLSEFLANISTALVDTTYNGILLFIVGDLGVSAYGAIGYATILFQTIFMGYILGVSPIVSYQFGAGNKSELHNVHRNNLLILLAGSVLLTVIAQVIAGPWSNLFSGGGATAQELAEMIRSGMRIYTLVFLLRGFNLYISSFFTALNNGAVSGLLSLCRALVFSMAAVIGLPLLAYYGGGEDVQAGLRGVWWAVIVAETLGLIMAVIFLKAKKKKYGY